MPPITPPGIKETRSRQFLLPHTRHLRTLEGARLTPQSEKRTRNKPFSFPPWNEIAVLKISSSYGGGCLRVALYLARVQRTGGSEFQSPTCRRTYMQYVCQSQQP